MRSLILFLLMLLFLVVAPFGQLSAQSRYDKKSSRNPHGSLNIPCENCHSNTSWKPIRSIPEFDHNRTSYPLRGMHEKVACTQCHTNLVFSSISTRCSDCHADIHRGQFGSKCEDCHTVKGWEIHTEQVKQHDNRFPLLGAHAMAECVDCHKGEAVGQFTGLSTACLSCHIADFKNATEPDHTSAFPTTCETCHTADTWFGAKFDHLKFTGFALTGAHATLECSACHIGGKYKGTPADCYGCHAKDFTTTTNPNHVQAGFPQQCQICHNTTSWLGATFDHTKYTKFPLTGAHVTVPCASCHINGQYSGTPTDCYSCHVKDFTGTTNPSHVQANFPTTCQTCHTTASWQGATFDHTKYTTFPLTGAHVNVPCNSCHINGQYAGTPTDCYSCHVKDYNGTANPNHVQAGFPQQCQMCHNTTSWSDSTFNHNNTPFPLTGAHVSVPCASCHINGQFAGTPTDCYSCHTKDYTGATNPNHVAAGFPTTCQTCHTTTSWAGATFNHNNTPFPLTGAHVNLPCNNCHINGQFAGTPTDCYSCHTKDYTGTTDPNHVAAGFPTTCQTCHTTTSWAGATFNHNNTPFPLTGAHVNVPCNSCHINNKFAGTPTDCYSCHTKDYTGTTNPNHVQAGFPTDCSICHSTTSWAGATFNHNNTPFPLTGAHVNLPCTSCHINGKFAGTPTDCYSCHTNDYKGTTNPNHVTAGFPTDCSICHTTTSWAGATFNHNNTPFPLTGAHVTVPCLSCHVGNVYAGTPTDCYSCHKADYNGTTDPNHAAAGFPTTCQTCHTTTSWQGATFNHTYFPMNHGNANGVCSTCHTNPNDYSVFTCTNCHTKSKTDPEHSGVSGYVYNSVNCYQCHKNGGGN